MKITTISKGLARVAINGGDRYAIISQNDNGRWEVRPDWEILTVGKSFPRFITRREAAQWAINTYGGKRECQK